jgi:hypothetical protein
MQIDGYIWFSTLLDVRGGTALVQILSYSSLKIIAIKLLSRRVDE